jgi:hypothetical protein
MDRACGMRRIREMFTRLKWENPRKGDGLEDRSNIKKDV